MKKCRYMPRPSVGEKKQNFFDIQASSQAWALAQWGKEKVIYTSSFSLRLTASLDWIRLPTQQLK